MSRSHPIWNQVTACKYNSNKSYGVSDTGKVNIKVGSSGSNSHAFLEHITTRRFATWKGKPVCIFKFSVDGVVLKAMIFEDNGGKAGKHLKTITKLNSIKSLKTE